MAAQVRRRGKTSPRAAGPVLFMPRRSRPRIRKALIHTRLLIPLPAAAARFVMVYSITTVEPAPGKAQEAWTQARENMEYAKKRFGFEGEITPQSVRRLLAAGVSTSAFGLSDRRTRRLENQTADLAPQQLPHTASLPWEGVLAGGDGTQNDTATTRSPGGLESRAQRVPATSPTEQLGHIDSGSR